MRRPGPLKDLPLDRFLPSNPNLPTKSPFKSSKKRAFESPALFSPAKRRILNEEAIFSTPSSSTRLIDILHGTPARKLDFGPSKNHAESSNVSQRAAEETPRREAATKLRPSPELAPRPVPTISLNDEMDDFFSSPCRLPRPNPSAVMTPIPVALLPLTDRHSIHYPGFDIHRDTHIIVPQPESAPPADPEPEAEKENVVPRRKARKAVTAPATADMKSALLSPEAKKRELLGLGRAQSTPATPKKSASSLSAQRDSAHSPTPRRSLRVGGSSWVMTGFRTGMPPLTRENVMSGKRMLVEEVDNVEGVEDD